jgi:HAD superfamily hydrolase (TIGR01509 family)
MTAPRVILFDIGSTLWSSPPEDPQALADCYGRARAVLLETIEEPPPIEELIEAVEGHFAEWEDRWRADTEHAHVAQGPTTDYVAKALERFELTLTPDALQRFTDALLDTSVYTAKAETAEEGMVEALEALRDRGLRLGCVSNAFMGAAVLDRIMDEKGLGRHLQFTVSSCEVGWRKPHPAIYEAALELMDVTAAETIFVGDRIDADVEGPAALGMRTVLTHQYREEYPNAGAVQPDAVIGHLRELVDYVDSLSKDEATVS